jgi:hypothetical protein
VEQDQNIPIDMNLVVSQFQLAFEKDIDGIQMDLSCGSRHFFCPQLSGSLIHYSAETIICNIANFPQGTVVYEGAPWGEMQMPYLWKVKQINNSWAIEANFEGHEAINNALAVIDHQQRLIRYYLDVRSTPALFDPFFHPLGILIFIYLALFHNGFVIHASGVRDVEKGYLFTGLSGIGKSTMAGLWQQKGAQVINDDRLMVMPVEVRGYKIYNTPMPYYQDVPKESPLNGIFLLKQSMENYCRQLSGATAMMRVMANCMQHFHTPDQIQQHLSIVEAISRQVPVFELGFKPDTDVVDLVRNMHL